MILVICNCYVFILSRVAKCQCYLLARRHGHGYTLGWREMAKDGELLHFSETTTANYILYNYVRRMMSWFVFSSFMLRFNDRCYPDFIESVPAWRNIPLPDTSPGRRCNVAHLRAMGEDPTCIPPDFNSSMLAVWEELWQSMPQSGKISVTVNNPCRSTESVAEPRGSDYDPHLQALQPCCQLHLHWRRIGCWGSRRPNQRPSRLVQWTRKHTRSLLISIALWLSGQLSRPLQ